MLIGERIKIYWQGPRRIRRAALWLGAAILLVAIVVFNQGIQDLFRFLAGRAAVEGVPQWTVIDPQVSQSRRLAELTDVTVGTKRYLYAMGGLDSAGNLLDIVERLELDPATGVPVTGKQWETAAGWGLMQSKRAAFRAFQYQNYLYVVSGDIHAPAEDDPTYINPLLFSTIERLNLNNELAGWQSVAILAGVNFYPEIKVFPNGTRDELHIVGGVYGYPKDFYSTPDLGGWDKYKNLPIIGEDKLLGLPDGGIGNNIKVGVVVGGTVVGMNNGSRGVWIAAVPNPNFAKMLSDASKSGDFVTTVSEHYVIDLDDGAEVYAGELGTANIGGNDYRGIINDTWKLNGVSHIAHLRILVQERKTTSPSGIVKDYLIDPAPQGRYGHRLFTYKESDTAPTDLYIVGGATWSGVIERVFYVTPSSGFTPYSAYLNTFWVIGDDVDPITWEVDDNPLNDAEPIIVPDGLFGFSYQYMGNVAYRLRWSDYRWQGTNPETNGSNPLDSKYAFSTGRAFFGFAKLKPSETETEYMAVAGLEDNVDPTKDHMWDINGVPPGDVSVPSLRHRGDQCTLQTPLCGDWGASVKVVDQTDRFSTNGWQEDTVLPSSIYNISAVGLANQTFAFGGAAKFSDPDQPFFNDHVPTIVAEPSAKSYLYKLDKTWATGTDVNANALHYAFLDVRTPLKIVGGKPRGERIMVYKVSGKDEKRVETIGPVIYGEEGVPDLTKTIMKIEPFAMPALNNGIGWSKIDVDNDGTSESVPTVYADRWDYATVTVSLKDYYGNAVDPAGLLVTLYTSRSPKPAVNKNVYGGANNLDDWIRIPPGTPVSDPKWHDNQFAVVDDNGEAKFRIGSPVNTFQNNGATPGFIDLKIYVITTGNQDILDGTPTGSRSQLVFTSHGVPSTKSKIVATSPVKPDGIAVSDITGTLLDWYYGEIPGKKIIIESDRNIDRSVPPNGYDPDDLNDHWDLILPKSTGSDITNSNGVVTFTAKSLHIRFAQLLGYVDNALDPNINGEVHQDDDPGQRARQQKLGVVSTYVNFSDQGEIISLIPSFGYQGQGQTAPWLTLIATGKNTSWTDAKSDATKNTEINFIRPTMSFFAGPKDNRQYDLDEVVIYADQFAKELGVEIAPNEGVNLKILQGAGVFYPCSGECKEINAEADSDGLVGFQYLPDPTEKGILKIQATAQTSDKIGNLWLPIRQSGNPLEVVMAADPPSVGVGALGQSVVTVGAYANGVLLDPSLVTYNFEKDESVTDGTLVQRPSQKYIADYTRQTDASGLVQVFVTITYGGQTQYGRVTITKLAASGDPSAKITLHNLSDLTVDETNQVINIGTPGKSTPPQGILIPSAAEVGSWIFQTLTPVFNLISNEWGPLTETYPFSVRPVGYQQGAYLDLIYPEQGFLGSEDNLIDIRGVNVTFDWAGAGKSVVTFTSYSYPGDSLTATIVSDPNNDALHLKVSLDIPIGVASGFWDVKVTTPGDPSPIEAEKSGHQDFLVTTPTGYLMQLEAIPPSIPRVEGNKSALTSTLSFINPYTGLLEPVPNIDTTFTLESANGGSLKDELAHKTDNAGRATNEYTTDTGDSTVKAKVKAKADLSSFDITSEVSAIVEIERTAEGTINDEPDVDESTMEVVTPVLVSSDGSEFSTVTVTVLNADGNPVTTGKKVVLAIVSGTGTIIPPGAQLTSNTDGQAIFKVWSSVVNQVTVKATITDTIVLPTKVINFVDSGVVKQFFSVTVPFQNRNYDNWVCTKIKDATHTGDIYIDYTGYFVKNDTSNLLTALESIPFYLYTSNTTYTVWGKGKNHLAKNATGKTAGAAGAKLTVSLATLPIGDIVTAASATSIKCPKPYHDNVINGVIPLINDIALIVSNAFKALPLPALPDLNGDGMVNVGDVIIGINNLGVGAPAP